MLTCEDESSLPVCDRGEHSGDKLSGDSLSDKMYCVQSSATLLLCQCLRLPSSSNAYPGSLLVGDLVIPRSSSSRSDKPPSSPRDLVRGGVWTILEDVRHVDHTATHERLTFHNTVSRVHRSSGYPSPAPSSAATGRDSECGRSCQQSG